LRTRRADRHGAAGAVRLRRVGDLYGTVAAARRTGAAANARRICGGSGKTRRDRPAVVAGSGGESEAETNIRMPRASSPRAVDATPSEADLQTDD